MKLTEQLARKYFAWVLTAIEPSAIERLVHELGYSGVITEDLLVKIYKECGAEFGAPLKKLTDQHLKTAQADVTLKVALGEVDMMSGKKFSRLTDEQKIDVTKSTLSTIGEWLGIGLKFYTTSKGATTEHDAEVAKWRAESESASSKTTLYVIAGAVVLIAVVAVVVAIVSGRRSQTFVK